MKNVQKVYTCENQTNNIEFLLLNDSKAYFVELKTSSRNLTQEQFNSYINFMTNFTTQRKRIKDILTTDIDLVKDVSTSKHKYEKIKCLLSGVNIGLTQITDFEMIYIVPTTLFNTYNGQQGIKWISIFDIANTQPYQPGDEKYDAWCEACNILRSIDK